jgi:SagB-type dehydrogenase family enzyme
MSRSDWTRLYVPGTAVGPEWEVFHENSKRTPYNSLVDNALKSIPLLDFSALPKFQLPFDLMPLEKPLFETLLESAPGNLLPGLLTVEQLATLLHCGCGVEVEHSLSGAYDSIRDAGSPSAVRAVELLFFTRKVKGLPTGLYAYEAEAHCLRQLEQSDLTARISTALLPRRMAVNASLLVFLVAKPEKLVDAHNNRGYRVALLKVGQVLRTLELTVTAMGLSCIGITEFYDRLIDRLLGLDGLSVSTIAIAAIGSGPKDGEL